jgi:DNA mismatch repair protein MutS
MGITRDYFAIQKHFEQKYGEHTIVCIQLGAFYEMYEFDPEYSDQIICGDLQGNVALKYSLKTGRADGVTNGETINLNIKLDDNEHMGHALDISLILNMKLTSKCKDRPHSIENCMMVGFPCASYENHRDLILFHGFTIVRIDQKDKTSEASDVEREVVEISSPGTEIDNMIMSQPTCSNNIVSIYIEYQKGNQNMENSIIVCGLSSIDVSTGINVVCEVYSRETDRCNAVQEIFRFLIAQKPIEIIVHVNKVPVNLIEEYMTYLNNNLELDKYVSKVIRCNQIEDCYLNDTYQESVFQKAFTDLSQKNVTAAVLQPGTSDIIYQLDLERFVYGRISYGVLLQFCFEHNENIIKKLQKPQLSWTDENKHLVMAHNAMLQLDIFPRTNIGYLGRRSKLKVFDSLISVIDGSSTNLGSRFLRRQLLNPITDTVKLESIYAMTDEMIHDEELLQFVNSSLKKIPDIEKYQRKIQIGLIRPKEFVTLFKGYQVIQQIYLSLYNRCFEEGSIKTHLKDLFMKEEDVTDFNACLNEVWTMIDLVKLDRVKFTAGIGGKQKKMQCDDSFINIGNDPEIDQIQDALQQFRNWIHLISEHLNSLLSGRVKKIELVFDRIKSKDDEEGVNGEMSVCLCATSATAKQLKGAQVNPQLCGSLAFQEINKTKTMITSEVIRQCCQGIELYQNLLEQRLLTKFYELVGKIAQRSYFAGLNNFIGMLDFVKNNSQIALKYKYYRPTIDLNATSAFINVTNARHPLIERIIRSEYVPNDIKLGNNGPNGALLYGVNSTGKTSFAKMLGCILMMAQSGFYCPGQVTYSPFHKIITRLSGEDDLLKGQSSFVVEMTELRTIRRGADHNTLVLGDELCRGTESLSGTSLTVAIVKTLIDKNVKFIFSTHMHHLPNIDMIKEYRQSGKLQISHLTATYDPSLDKLVYNRKLENGQGSSQYGLEVCKSLNIDKEFLDLANEIRKGLDDIPDLFQSNKKSRYNNRVYVDNCSFCSSPLSLQTHHIKEQNKADNTGFIDHYHKNSQFNLLVLCDTCHKHLHSTNIQLVQKQTLEGIYIERVTEVKTSSS